MSNFIAGIFATLFVIGMLGFLVSHIIQVELFHKRMKNKIKNGEEIKVL